MLLNHVRSTCRKVYKSIQTRKSFTDRLVPREYTANIKIDEKVNNYKSTSDKSAQQIKKDKIDQNKRRT